MAPSRGLSLARIRLELCPSVSEAKHARFRPLRGPKSSAKFHTSRRNSFAPIESSIEAVHTGITFLHSTIGLPWYIALPMTAIVLRTAILPLQIIAQRNRQQRATLTPKVLEARPELERKVIAKYNHLGPEKCTRLLSWELAKKREELRRQAGISYWAGWAPLAQLPVWLVAIETIRRMSGVQEGLLGIVFGRSSVENATVASTAMSTSSTNPDQTNQIVPGIDSMPSMTLSETANYNPLFEPSLSTGGFLWFPDLLSPDPMLILPFTLSAVIFASVTWEERLVEAAGIQRPRWSIGLTRGIKIVALFIGPATLQMPAAMLVYWVTSSSTAFLQKAIVDKIVPVDRAAIASASTNNNHPRSDATTRVQSTTAPNVKRYSPMRKPIKKR